MKCTYEKAGEFTTHDDAHEIWADGEPGAEELVFLDQGGNEIRRLKHGDWDAISPPVSGMLKDRNINRR